MLSIYNKPYIIGETAFHHQGDKDFLLRLIDEAANLGLPCIKFHLLLEIESYMAANHKAINDLKKWIFHKEEWKEIIKTAHQKGLEVLALCNEPESAEFIMTEDLPVSGMELHATGLNDIFLLELAKQFNGTIVLGIGGSTIDEINYAINYLNQNEQKDILLMHGFQNYPTDPKEVNLLRGLKTAELFDLPVGYADHTDPNDDNNALISATAFAMGFDVLEKHFTITHEPRIDSQAAVSIKTMKQIIDYSETINLVTGSGKIEYSDSEKKYGDTGPMKKAIVAKKEIEKGEEITLENVWFKRTNESVYLKQNALPSILGLKANQNIPKDGIVDFSVIDYQFKAADFGQFKNE